MILEISPPKFILLHCTCVYVVGYFLRASSVSKIGGSLLKMSEATSSRISSFDLPPPEVVRAYQQKTGKMFIQTIEFDCLSNQKVYIIICTNVRSGVFA